MIKKLLKHLALGLITWLSVCHGADRSDQAGKLVEQYEWAGRNCLMPTGKFPPRAYFADPFETDGDTKRKKKTSLRSQVDPSGDGICDIYDVMGQEVSAFTGKIYGYAVRITKYKDGKWLSGSSALSWVPVVLRKKDSASLIRISLSFAGESGYSFGFGFDEFSDHCTQQRLLIAASYMLIFHPPPEMHSDPALSEEWTGPVNSIVKNKLLGEILSPNYIEIKMPELSTCMAPYQVMITDLRSALEKVR